MIDITTFARAEPRAKASIYLYERPAIVDRVLPGGRGGPNGADRLGVLACVWATTADIRTPGPLAETTKGVVFRP